MGGEGGLCRGRGIRNNAPFLLLQEFSLQDDVRFGSKCVYGGGVGCVYILGVRVCVFVCIKCCVGEGDKK